MSTRLIDVGTRFRKLLAANSTNTTAPTKVDTLTEPTSENVIHVGPNSEVAKKIVISPFGVGADNNTFDVYVYGWDYIPIDSTTGQWHPVLLCLFTATLSASIPGVAGGAVAETNYYADTLGDPTVGTLGVTCEKISPANNQAGIYSVNISGFKKIEIVTDVGTATSANALYRLV